MVVFVICTIICIIIVHITEGDSIGWLIAASMCVGMIFVSENNIDYYPGTYFGAMGVFNYDSTMSVKEQDFLYNIFTQSGDCSTDADHAEANCKLFRADRMKDFGAFIKDRKTKPSEQAVPFCDAGGVLYEMQRGSEQPFLTAVDRNMFTSIWRSTKDGKQVENDWSLRRRQWYAYVMANGCAYGKQPEVAKLDPETGERIEPGTVVDYVAPVARNDKGNGIKIAEELEGISIDDMERLKEQSKTCKPARDRILDAMIDKGSLDTSDWDSVAKAINYCQNVDLANLVKG